MYRVEFDEQVQQQIDALPAETLADFAELRTLLELVPWTGNPINAGNPDGPVRVAMFGPTGLGIVTYLILDDRRRVELLQIVWLGLPG